MDGLVSHHRAQGVPDQDLGLLSNEFGGPGLRAFPNIVIRQVEGHLPQHPDQRSLGNATPSRAQGRSRTSSLRIGRAAARMPCSSPIARA